MTSSNETTGELIPYQQPAAPARVDMRDRVTDSWTSVVTDVAELAQRIHQTEFVPTSLRGSVPKVAAAVLHGRELGLPPMTALSSVHVINGRAGISAEVMRSLILQAGHEFYTKELSSLRCVIVARRRNQEEWSTFAYTMDEAKNAGDASKNPNYRTRPSEMLFARCTTRMARAIFADVIHGMRSTEELEDMTEGTVTVIAQPAPARTVARKAVAAAVEPARPEPNETPAPIEETAAPARTASRRPVRREPARGRKPAPPQTTGESEGEAPTGSQGRDSTPGEDSTTSPGGAVEILEAEIVEAAAGMGAAQDGQIRAIVTHLQRLGVADREERLYWTGIAAGRGDHNPPGSSKELSQAEAATALERLSRVRDRGALEALGAALEAGNAQS